MKKLRFVVPLLATIPLAFGVFAATNGCGGAGVDDDEGGRIAVSVSPKFVTIAPSTTQQFSATVTGGEDTDVTWSVVEPSGGSVTTGGLYTAPATAGTYHVRASSQANPAVSDTASVTVSVGGGATVAVSPKTVTLAPSANQQFSATVTGSANTSVTWSVIEPSGGSVTSGGMYTAPTTSGTYHVKATSVADPSASDTATVTVSGGTVTVSVSPKTVTLAALASQQFSATVTGTPNTSVTWTVDEAGGGSVTSGGLYTAPASAGTYHVRATSVASPAVSDAATVTVAAAGPALQFSLDSTIIENGTTKATSLTKVELMDTSGAVVKTATINVGVASIDMSGLAAGHYFLRVNDLADDLVPTRIDNPGVAMVQGVGTKLRITRVGPAGNPTYRFQTFSKGQAWTNVVKYSNGTAATPQAYAYGLLYLKTSPMKIEMRTMGTAALLSTETYTGPHPFATWMMRGGSAPPHGDPANYTGDGACSCHGNLNTKVANYSSINKENGWCYKCHYGKTGSSNGFVNPGQ